MTTEESNKVKEIIEMSIKSVIDTFLLNYKVPDNIKEYLNRISEYEIKCSKDDVDRLDPHYWDDKDRRGIWVEWNRHHPM